MRLIVKDYILQLREKDELDLLICNLFVQRGYKTDTVPKTGSRQYGVDIKMHGKDELLLFVVKQGNITRKIWNGDVNAVRQSLDEIQDVVFPNLKEEEKQKKIVIYVATNGTKDQSIEVDFSGYVRSFEQRTDLNAEILFLGVDDIVEDVLKYYFNEYLFDENMRSDLRKALYYIGEDEYKRIFYERIIDGLIDKITLSEGRTSRRNKACATLYIVSQMICHYAHDAGCDKTAINISEYLLIRFWLFLKEHNLFGKTYFAEWLIKYCKRYEAWNDCYLKKIELLSTDKARLPSYGVVEDRCMTYEILGYLLSYTWYLYFFQTEKADRTLNTIVALLNMYRSFCYVPYDNSIAVVIMLYRIMEQYGRYKEIKDIMREQTYIQMMQYRFAHKFPAPTDTYEEAAKIEEGTDAYAIPYEVSGFWGYYLLLIAKYNDREIYDNLKEFLSEDLKDTSKCVWFCRGIDEDALYSVNAMQRSGVGVEIRVHAKYDDFFRETSGLLTTYGNEKFSFDEYGFKALEMLICRYYGYIPRVIGPKED